MTLWVDKLLNLVTCKTSPRCGYLMYNNIIQTTISTNQHNDSIIISCIGEYNGVAL